MCVCANSFVEAKRCSGGLVLWQENTAGPETEENPVICLFGECRMGKKDNFFAGIGFQIIETDLILFYTKFRIIQWEPTELVGKHPASPQGTGHTESNQWWKGEKTVVVAEEQAFYIP